MVQPCSTNQENDRKSSCLCRSALPNLFASSYHSAVGTGVPSSIFCFFTTTWAFSCYILIRFWPCLASCYLRLCFLFRSIIQHSLDNTFFAVDSSPSNEALLGFWCTHVHALGFVVSFDSKMSYYNPFPMQTIQMFAWLRRLVTQLEIGIEVVFLGRPGAWCCFSLGGGNIDQTISIKVERFSNPCGRAPHPFHQIRSCTHLIWPDGVGILLAIIKLCCAGVCDGSAAEF